MCDGSKPIEVGGWDDDLFHLTSAEYSFIDCGNDGETEFVLCLRYGDSGDFNYALKFADGRLICFQRITITDAASVAWGNCYRATVNPSSNYAVSFIAQPITVEHFTSKSVNDNTSWAVNVGGPSMIKPQQIYLVRPSSGNINGTLNIVAYGYWK